MILGTDTVDVQCLSGSQAASLVPMLWDRLNAKRRRILFWEISDNIPTTLAQLIALATASCVLWVNGELQGMSWVIPLGKGSRCGVIHLAFAGPAWQARAVARIWIRDVLPTQFDSLICILPQSYRHVRQFALSLGFIEVTRMPGAICMLARDGRYQPAVMYQRNLNG